MYEKKASFLEKLNVWNTYINKYSNDNYNVLDIGCGSGRITFELAKKNKFVTGIDQSEIMLNICKKQKKNINCKNIEFVKYDFLKLNNLNIENVDIITCSSVLEYVSDLNGCMELCYNKLCNSGIFIFSIPNKSSIYRKIEYVTSRILDIPKYAKFIQNMGTLKSILPFLAENKFELLEFYYFGKTNYLSKLFDKFKLNRFSDNMLLIVAKKS